MVKRALTLLTSILIALHLLMPFNIYADTITNSNVLGINTILLSKTQNIEVTNSWYYVYQHTITLDADYIGTITFDVNLTYINPSGSSSTYGTSTINNKTYFVNGNTITINQIVTSDNFGNQGPIVSSSYLLKSSNVIKTSTITELQQIIDLLNDIYSSEDQVEGLLNNQLQQLQICVQNTSLANTYLETLSNLRQYNFPFESFNFVYSLYKRNYEIKDLFNNGYYSYPIYSIKKDNYIFKDYYLNNNEKAYCIFYSFKNLIPLANNVSYNFHLLSWTSLNYVNINGFIVYLYYIEFDNNSESSIQSYLQYINSSDFDLIPIFLATESKSKYISTDFALLYGLSNPLLDNINKIANGTTASQSTSQYSDSANSQLQTESNTLFQQENNFKSDMQNSMQNVNTTFRLENMGSKFVSSAQWVRTQYENLTNNTPFASLITFSLITGLALILLGKVYK